MIAEPMLCCLESGQRPDHYAAVRQQPLKHAAGFHEITRVTFTSPGANNRSPEFQATINAKLVELQVGDNYCLELGFDGEQQGKRTDFRPALPLILHW
jgi:hypothetical protein